MFSVTRRMILLREALERFTRPLNHSFSDDSDGNKRIAAAIFLFFMDRNQALFRDG